MIYPTPLSPVLPVAIPPAINQIPLPGIVIAAGVPAPGAPPGGGGGVVLPLPPNVPPGGCSMISSSSSNVLILGSQTEEYSKLQYQLQLLLYYFAGANIRNIILNGANAKSSLKLIENKEDFSWSSTDPDIQVMFNDNRIFYNYHPSRIASISSDFSSRIFGKNLIQKTKPKTPTDYARKDISDYKIHEFFSRYNFLRCLQIAYFVSSFSNLSVLEAGEQLFSNQLNSSDSYMHLFHSSRANETPPSFTEMFHDTGNKFQSFNQMDLIVNFKSSMEKIIFPRRFVTKEDSLKRIESPSAEAVFKSFSSRAAVVSFKPIQEKLPSVKFTSFDLKINENSIKFDHEKLLKINNTMYDSGIALSALETRLTEVIYKISNGEIGNALVYIKQMILEKFGNGFFVHPVVVLIQTKPSADSIIKDPEEFMIKNIQETFCFVVSTEKDVENVNLDDAKLFPIFSRLKSTSYLNQPLEFMKKCILGLFKRVSFN